MLPKIRGSWFFFGMLLLVGGILFVYFAYVAYPGYFLNFVFPGGPVDLGGVFLMLLLPLIAVFAGGVLVYVSIGGEPVQQKETFVGLPLPPPLQACPHCGGPLTFVQQYGRFYGYGCNEYQ
jgi:hypothetical protein